MLGYPSHPFSSPIRFVVHDSGLYLKAVSGVYCRDSLDAKSLILYFFYCLWLLLAHAKRFAGSPAIIYVWLYALVIDYV